jgi:hypothetical protein
LKTIITLVQIIVILNKLIIYYYCGLEGLFPGFSNTRELADDMDVSVSPRSGGPKNEESRVDSNLEQIPVSLLTFSTVFEPVFDSLIFALFGLEGLSPVGSYTSLLADPVFEPVLDPVLDPVTEIDEPIVESIFEALDPMTDSSVDLNLEPLEDSAPEPLNDESIADPSLEQVLEPVVSFKFCFVFDLIYGFSHVNDENIDFNFLKILNQKIH